MSAMEKVAWTELLITSLTILIVLALLLFLDYRSASAFALLGAVFGSLWFIRGRRKKIIIDERDREIEKESARRGVETAWMFLVISLIAVVMLGPKNSSDQSESSIRDTLNWLIWIQFSIYLGIKGLMGVLYYRRQSHGA